jgi:hypothetical protein
MKINNSGLKSEKVASSASENKKSLLIEEEKSEKSLMDKIKDDFKNG